MQNPFKLLSFQCEADQAELLSDWLAENEALSVTLKDAADEPLFVEAVGKMSLWKKIKIEALFPPAISLEIIKQKLNQQFSIDSASYEETELADSDWEKSFRQYFPAQCFAGRFWVYPAWATEPREEPYMLLEPGLAFGTGTHPTTKLCLNYLASQDLTDKTLIDYGCGSGILAIAAAKLAAKKIYAVDHDPQALQAIRTNAVLNQIEKALNIFPPEKMPAIKADLLVANIFSSVLIELRDKFFSYLKPNGQCILSGILLTQLNEIEKHYAPYFKKEDELIEDEWVMVILKKAQ